MGKHKKRTTPGGDHKTTDCSQTENNKAVGSGQQKQQHREDGGHLPAATTTRWIPAVEETHGKGDDAECGGIKVLSQEEALANHKDIVAIHPIELTPESAVLPIPEGKKERETLVLYVRQMGITKYGKMRAGMEARVVARERAHQPDGVLFTGTPLCLRVCMAGLPEWEMALFGHAPFTLNCMSMKLVFANIAVHVANSGLAYEENKKRAKKKQETSTEPDADVKPAARDVPSLRVACVICKHPVASRRYVVARDCTATATPGMPRAIVQAFYGSTFFYEGLCAMDDVLNSEELRLTGAVESGTPTEKTDEHVPKLIPRVRRAVVRGVDVAISPALPVFEDELDEVIHTLCETMLGEADVVRSTAPLSATTTTTTAAVSPQ